MSDDKQINVALDDIMPIIAEQLQAGGNVTFGPKGVSMLPLIRQNIDSVVISPYCGKLKKYDVPLYKRENGQYVLHRVIGFKNGAYVMRGDNQYQKEYGITDKQIIGVMSAVVKPEKKISVNDSEYVRYARKRVFSQSLHAFASKIKSRLKRILRR